MKREIRKKPKSTIILPRRFPYSIICPNTNPLHTTFMSPRMIAPKLSERHLMSQADFVIA